MRIYPTGPDPALPGPYELAGVWRGDDGPPKLIGIRNLAGRETGVRIDGVVVERRPGETTYAMVHRAAATHGTARRFTLLYAEAK